MRNASPILALLTLVCHCALTWANAAPPWQSGDSTGEPHGLGQVRIDRETLTIDLAQLTAWLAWRAARPEIASA